MELRKLVISGVIPNYNLLITLLTKSHEPSSRRRSRGRKKGSDHGTHKNIIIITIISIVLLPIFRRFTGLQTQAAVPAHLR